MHLCSSSCFAGLSRRGFLAGTAAAALTAGCSASQAASSGLENDVRLGAQQYPELIRAFGGAYTHDGVQDYVTNLGRTLAAHTENPDLPYEFTVLNTPIVNAVALPGGKIGVTRGLLALASSEAELAGVLSHEIGHVNARHGARSQNRATIANLGLAILGLATKSNELVQLGQTVAAGFLQNYSREQEFEADTLGVRYMSRANYDPGAMATFLASLREHSQLEARMQGLPPGEVDKFNIMASHPRTVERVREAQAAAQMIRLTDPIIGRDSYLTAINGMIFADDPAQGFVRGRRFVHTGLGITFEVPEGFTLRNSPEQVAAQNPGGASIVFDMDVMQRSRNFLEYLQYEWLSQISLGQLENLVVNGLPAATGAARVSSGGGPVDVRGVVYPADRGQVFRFLFITPARQSRGLGRALRDTTYSFRNLTDEERRGTHPLRMITAQVHDGDTVEQLASTLPYGDFNSDWFRLLNDIGPGQILMQGQTVKIVVG